MKKYSIDKYLFNFKYFFIIMIGIVLFLSVVLLPIKETISCGNKICSVKDYSFLITYNRSFDLNNKHIYIGGPGRCRTLKPISNCCYFNFERMNKDKYMFDNENNVYTKHISLYGILVLGVVLMLMFTQLDFNKRTFLCIMLLALLRSIYVLII